MASSSSFWPFSSFCLGSSFLLSASKSRRPSLGPKMACSMLIFPTLVPEPVVTGVEAAGVAGAAGGAGDGRALLVWASAEIAKKTASDRESRKNLLVIGSLELLGTWFR